MIDVVIPVYRGVAETRRCLESVLANCPSSACEVVVVDDATPEPEIAAWLDSLASEGRITLLRNEHNLGFVQSVNRGMALHADRDVVLLNSDTEVANDWLDRLHRAAHRAADIGTATPFSNNATICSYPFEGWGGGVPGTLGLAALDRVFAAANAGEALEIPTAVGFCMLIRRDCLAQVGLFDAERYGRGYGEENDFCMRAGKARWRHVLAADVFVYHEGSVSFSEERFDLMRHSAQALVQAHPEYPRKVHEFVRVDPPSKLRTAIDLARVAVGAEEARHVLNERVAERTRILDGLWQIERLAAERDSKISELHYGLQNATALLNERDRVIAERDALITRLQAGLDEAQRLAFERADELARIYNSRTWRLLRRIRRLV